jgi:hypothetical protein
VKRKTTAAIAVAAAACAAAVTASGLAAASGTSAGVIVVSSPIPAGTYRLVKVTPAPTPTPTPRPSPTPAPAGTACVTTANGGSCGPYPLSPLSSNNPGASVIQDAWNPAAALKSQVLTAYSASRWSVSANAAAGNLAVLSYPDTQQVATTSQDHAQPYGLVSSSYSVTAPAAGDYEWAYDIWGGSTTSTAQGTQEIMIWVYNHGQVPAGVNTGKTLTLDGVTYRIWASSGNATVTLASEANAPAGTVPVAAAMNDLAAAGYVAAGQGYSQVDFGVEICSTGGSPETFSVNGYSLG